MEPEVNFLILHKTFPDLIAKVINNTNLKCKQGHKLYQRPRGWSKYFNVSLNNVEFDVD